MSENFNKNRQRADTRQRADATKVRPQKGDDRRSRSKSKSKNGHEEERSFQGSDLRKRKKKHNVEKEGQSISRVDSFAALDDPDVQNVIKKPGDMIITPQEVGITSSKNNSEKMSKSKKDEQHEERKSHRK